MIKQWPLLSSRPLQNFRIFDVRTDTKQSPRTGAPCDFYIIQCPDWVNVIATTSARELVMVEQYRHGSNSVELEIPGGMIDRTDSSPVAAGLRELAEETGYTGRQAELLGQTLPNPAIMTNICHTVLVRDCQLTNTTQFDPGEDLHTVLIPVSQIPTLITSGKIRHSLVVVALTHFLLKNPQ